MAIIPLPFSVIQTHLHISHPGGIRLAYTTTAYFKNSVSSSSEIFSATKSCVMTIGHEVITQARDKWPRKSRRLRHGDLRTNAGAAGLLLALGHTYM